VTKGSTAFRLLRPQGTSRFVLVCDHASHHIPAGLHDLGLPASALTRHIAWDIGAAGVTEALSEILDAPAILSSVSRLVIDCNRQLVAPSLIPEASDGTRVPGNRNLTEGMKASRIESWFRPYHDAVEAVLVERDGRGVDSIFVSIHSMTPTLGGTWRPWPIALSSHQDRRLTDPMLAALRQQEGAGVVGDNQPYDLDPSVDYTVPVHAMQRGRLHVQVEFRQDEIADATTERHWAHRFAQALALAARTAVAR
jgi:predicted N-formylglutamate amidohydrolase